MVLIFTDKFDVHADVVIEKLKMDNVPYYRFNLDVQSLKNAFISFKNGEWIIKSEAGEISTNRVSCVWCRKAFVELTLQEKRETSADFKIWKNEWNKTLLGLHNSLKQLPWLNPLRKAYKGENKYYQIEVAKDIGFEMPDTLISNEKHELLQFMDRHKKCLFKLMAQDFYEVGNEFKGLYTNVITKTDLEKFSEVGENPLVLQEYITKQFEVRYTVVGKEHFVCKIESQKSEKANEDWRRYDIAHTPHSIIEPPTEIKEKVNRLMEILGLEYGALDFIVTPDDKWIFLEINCMGQYLWIEELTGLQISNAIVGWLKNHTHA
jgi:glutathione synthase/RimK-type ligase-like ATP-grasp enzyme